jgi:protein arginine kinase
VSETPGFAFTPAVIRRGVDWLRGAGADADVVISSRVRLARNLSGFPFVCRCPHEQRQRILDRVRERIAAARLAERMLWVDVHACPPGDRMLLLERHLISKELASPKAPNSGTQPGTVATDPAVDPEGPRAVAISLPDEQLSIMVNEEDHLRIQVLASGLNLTELLARIERVDDRLEGAPIPGAPAAAGTPDPDGLEWSYSQRFGYLTACPTNVGTAMRVSVMLHLPGLKLASEMEKVKRATRDMHLAVRGYYGEHSEATGEFYQISNQTTLGKPERLILDELEREIVPRIIDYERAARRMLVEKRRRFLEDQVFRALGALRSARLLNPEEALTLLSLVRLGILTGLVHDVAEQTVNQLLLLTQPAHLQRLLGQDLDQNARREARADLVRKQLGSA